MPGTPKRLVLLCQQCGTGSPSSGPRQQSRRRKRLRNSAGPRASQEVHLGGYAAGRIRELGGNDHTHPRIPQASHRSRTLPRASTSTSSATTIRTSPRCCRTPKCSTPSRPIRRRKSSSCWPGSAAASTSPRCRETRAVLAAGATAGPDLLRQHHQEGDRDRRSLRGSASRSLPSIARPRWRRSRAPRPAAG